MKKLLIIALTVGAFAQPVSHACAAERSSGREVAGVSGGALVGALAAGPVGVIVGAALGGHYGASVDGAKKATQRTAELNEALARERALVQTAEAELNQLAQALALADKEIADLDAEIDELFVDRAVLHGLNFDVTFRTAGKDMSDTDKARVVLLAELMKRVPDLTIQLDGHADPRGDASYNDDLSLKRARAVAAVLAGLGVDEQRIRTLAHGESLARAPEGDVDGYAHDRRVAIKLGMPAAKRDDSLAHAP